jgi:hypothetical protein
MTSAEVSSLATHSIVKVKLYMVQNLASVFILGVNYLFALRATLDFDREEIRRCHPSSGLRFTIEFASRDRDLRQVYSSVPQAGAVSMGSACVAHGYFGEVPATTSIFIANPASYHVNISARYTRGLDCAHKSPCRGATHYSSRLHARQFLIGRL